MMPQFRKEIPATLVLIRDPMFTLAAVFHSHSVGDINYGPMFNLVHFRERSNNAPTSHIRTMHSLRHRHPRHL